MTQEIEIELTFNVPGKDGQAVKLPLLETTTRAAVEAIIQELKAILKRPFTVELTFRDVTKTTYAESVGPPQ